MRAINSAVVLLGLSQLLDEISRCFGLSPASRLCDLYASAQRLHRSWPYALGKQVDRTRQRPASAQLSQAFLQARAHREYDSRPLPVLADYLAEQSMPPAHAVRR